MLSGKDCDMEFQKATFILFKRLRRLFVYVDKQAATTLFVDEVNIFSIFRDYYVKRFLLTLLAKNLPILRLALALSLF